MICQLCGRAMANDQDEWTIRVWNAESISDTNLIRLIACRRCIDEVVELLETKRRAAA